MGTLTRASIYVKRMRKNDSCPHVAHNGEQEISRVALTAVLYETGALPVPTELQNPGDRFHSYLTHSKGFVHFRLFQGHPRPKTPKRGVNQVPRKINFLLSVF